MHPTHDHHTAGMGKGKKGGGGRKGRGGGHGPGPSNKPEEGAARKAAKKQRQKGKRFDDAEERQYEAQLAAIGGTIHHMASDGNCLYRAFFDQLEGARHCNSSQVIFLSFFTRL